MGTVTSARDPRPRTTYRFRVVIEPDGDLWHAYCPALQEYGGATWGATRDEALQHIAEVAQLVIESMVEHGEAIPASSSDRDQAPNAPTVTVTL